jgi:hypothetical protein
MEDNERYTNIYTVTVGMPSKAGTDAKVESQHQHAGKPARAGTQAV